jgi:alkyldihydroxyacetonephosphate synthase
MQSRQNSVTFNHKADQERAMNFERSRLRWNGWGLIDGPDVLGEKSDAVWAWMARTLGVDPLPSTPAMPLSNIGLPAIRLNEAIINELQRLTSPDRVKTDEYERAFHARGKSYHDLLHVRAGHLDTAPDAVVYPANADETLALVKFAVRAHIALVPFGGGSSVVGGVTGTAWKEYAGVITVDMTRMNRVLEIDETALVARIEAGMYGPQLEDALQAKGYTLGHYPQSWEYSTVGGWIAPRSGGHQSNMYGKAEHWLVSATLATPEGMWTTSGFPGSAAGPQLRDIVAGSEGTLGIITDAVVKIHLAPEVKDYRGYVFSSFEAGVDATREMMQQGVPTAMIRLSDANETFFYNALHTGGVGADGPVVFCLMLVGIEGSAAKVEYTREQTKAIIAAHGGIHMGETLGKTWYQGRFEMPYLRDPMMDRGLGVDTLETATRWSNIVHVHDIVSKAIDDAMAANPAAPGARGIVMSHVSHSYRDGASLYFTFAFARDLAREVDQWWAIKRAASDAVIANGGTISHHHGVGTDHVPWLEKEKGPIAMTALRAVKEKLDPTGIMNPGKLLG